MRFLILYPEISSFTLVGLAAGPHVFLSNVANLVRPWTNLPSEFALFEGLFSEAVAKSRKNFFGSHQMVSREDQASCS